MSLDYCTLRYVVDNGYNKKEAGELSHTAMDGVINGIYCPPQSLDTLRERWAEDVVARRPLFLSEYGHKEHHRAFMDIDLHLADCSKWSLELFRAILVLIQEVMCKFFANLVPAEAALADADKRFLLIVLDRKKILSDDKTTTSFGYHLHYPNLTISVPTAVQIRSYILLCLDTTHKHLLPPGAEPWSGIFDENVFIGSRGPHIRGPLCHKCKQCDCRQRSVVCIHAPPVSGGGNARRKQPMMLIRDSLYEHIVVAFDHAATRLPDVEAAYNVYGVDRRNDQAHVLRFIKKMSIRTETTQIIPVPPADFKVGYKSKPVKRKKSDAQTAGDEDLDEETSERCRLVYEFMEQALGLQGQLAPVKTMKFCLQRKGSFYSIMSTSRRCVNKGSNHSTASTIVVVSSVTFC